MQRISPLVLIGLGLILGGGVGCGGSKVSKAPAAMQAAKEAEAPQQPPAGQPGAAAKAPLVRKIIYTAELQVIVEDFGKAEKSLDSLVKQNKGYLAQSEISNSPGAPRSGRWRVRVPVDHFDAFRDAVAGLGEVAKNSTDAQDVTDEFYDLQARIKNKQKEEQRLNELMQKATGKLEDVLKIEEVLSRVREEIERMQGQAQRLTNLSSLTTVTVTLNERRSYVPPEAPGFGTTVGRTFQGSLDALVGLGRAVALTAVALTPWLPVLAVVAVLFWLALRRRRIPTVRPLPPQPGPPPA